MELQYLHVSNLPVGMHMSGYEPQSQQCIVQQTSTSNPATSVQQGSTSTPSTGLLGPSSIPHLSPSTPSGDSLFNPYCATLKTPTPMLDHLDCKLKPNLAAGHCRRVKWLVRELTAYNTTTICRYIAWIKVINACTGHIA